MGDVPLGAGEYTPVDDTYDVAGLPPGEDSTYDAAGLPPRLQGMALYDGCDLSAVSEVGFAGGQRVCVWGGGVDLSAHATISSVDPGRWSQQHPTRKCTLTVSAPHWPQPNAFDVRNGLLSN